MPTSTNHPGLIRRTFTPTTKALNVGRGIYEGVITSEAPDRGQDVIVAMGGQLDNYLRNPVVPFAHSYNSLPVARALEIKVEPARIIATWEFVPEGVHRLGDEVRELWQRGFLNALSVGIWPLKWEQIDPKSKDWFPPLRFTEWELLEFSIVTIPMHPDAVRAEAIATAKALPGTYPTRYGQREKDELHEEASLIALAESLKNLRSLLKE